MKSKAKKKPVPKASRSAPQRPAAKTAKPAAKPAKATKAKAAKPDVAHKTVGKTKTSGKPTPQAPKPKKQGTPRSFDEDDDIVLDAADLENEALGGEIDGETIEIEIEEEDIELDLESDLVEETAVQVSTSEEDIVLTDAEGNRYCRSRDCDQIATVDAYCRFHYLLFWKKIQVRKKILTDGKLARYVDELTARYPDKFLEMIRRDLRTEKDFVAAIQELEIDESGLDNEYEEDTQSFIDEVRGMGDGAGDSVEDDY